MNNKVLIVLIALIGFSISISPIMAAEPVVSDYVLFDWNPFAIFADHSNDLTITKLHISKVKKQHTDSSGKTKKSTDYTLKFNVKSNIDQMNKYKIKVKCLDKNGDIITTVESYIDSEGSVKIPLKDVSGIKKAELTILDDSNNVIFKNTTSKIKTTEKITKDKPVEKKTTTSASSTSNSGTTYWASSNSDKFHYPSCEWAQKISSRNKVVFHSRSEALNSGFQPCQVCSP